MAGYALPNPNGTAICSYVAAIRNASDLTRRSRHDTWIIDFGTGLSEDEAALFEATFCYMSTAYVKPEAKYRNVSQYSRK